VSPRASAAREHLCLLIGAGFALTGAAVRVLRLKRRAVETPR
jgi:hypothetical protein